MHGILLCDLDGTLVDTVADLAAALNATLAEAGLAPLGEATVRRLVGRGAPQLVADGFATAGRPLSVPERDVWLQRFLAIYDAAPAQHSRPYPGVAETLAELRAAGWRLGVCTNKPQAPSEIILETFGLAEFFDAVGGGDRFPVRKPDGAHLHATLELMGGTAEHAVLVGDSVTDVQAARDAGLPVVLVPYGYAGQPVASLAPDAVVSAFAELPAVLGGLCPPGGGVLGDRQAGVR